MIDTSRLRNYSKWIADLDNANKPKGFNREDYEVLSGLLRDAAEELDAARNANLVKYRCAALTTFAGATTPSGGKTHAETCAEKVEKYAHAVLAGERAPSPSRPASAPREKSAGSCARCGERDPERRSGHCMGVPASYHDWREDEHVDPKPNDNPQASTASENPISDPLAKKIAQYLDGVEVVGELADQLEGEAADKALAVQEWLVEEVSKLRAARQAQKAEKFNRDFAVEHGAGPVAWAGAKVEAIEKLPDFPNLPFDTAKLRDLLVDRLRRYAASSNPANFEKWRVLNAMLEGESLAEEGNRHNSIHLVASLLGYTFPPGTPWEIALAFLRTSLSTMYTCDDGYNLWVKTARASYERTMARRNRKPADILRELETYPNRRALLVFPTTEIADRFIDNDLYLSDGISRIRRERCYLNGSMVYLRGVGQELPDIEFDAVWLSPEVDPSIIDGVRLRTPDEDQSVDKDPFDPRKLAAEAEIGKLAVAACERGVSLKLYPSEPNGIMSIHIAIASDDAESKIFATQGARDLPGQWSTFTGPPQSAATEALRRVLRLPVLQALKAPGGYGVGISIAQHRPDAPSKPQATALNGLLVHATGRHPEDAVRKLASGEKFVGTAIFDHSAEPSGSCPHLSWYRCFRVFPGEGHVIRKYEAAGVFTHGGAVVLWWSEVKS